MYIRRGGNHQLSIHDFVNSVVRSSRLMPPSTAIFGLFIYLVFLFFVFCFLISHTSLDCVLYS